MYSDPHEAIQLAVESILSESINTSMPASIMSYDAAKNRAVIKPDLPKRLDNGNPLESPKVVEIPIAWPSAVGGKASLTMPLQAGDPLVSVVQQRSLEGWLDGHRTMPNDPRQFDISDSIAIPGGGASGTVADPNHVVLKFDKCFLSLHNDNSLVLGNDKATITIDPSGVMTLKAQSIKIDTPSNAFTLETHKHSQGSDSDGDGEVDTNQPVAGS
jgi:hypothetical protein